MSRYKTPEGKELWVSCGISSGTTWFTATTRKSGRGQQRYKSPALPLRETEEAAQADLDLYAKSKGFRPC